MLFTSATLAIAQDHDLTIADLIEKTSCKTLDCYSEYITKKSFVSDKSNSKKGKDFNMHCFQSTFDCMATTELDKKLRIKNFSRFYIYTDSATMIDFSTVAKFKFNALLEQLKEAGFKSTGTKELENGTSESYGSDKYPKIHISAQKQETYDKTYPDYGPWTTYYISVYKDA